MSTGIDHKVAIHRLVSERRAQGKPVWAETITGFRAAFEKYDSEHPDADMIRTVRDQLVTVLESSNWYRNADEFGDLRNTVDELTGVANPAVFSPTEEPDYDPVRHFNSVLAMIYDMADYDRVWLG